MNTWGTAEYRETQIDGNLIVYWSVTNLRASSEREILNHVNNLTKESPKITILLFDIDDEIIAISNRSFN